MLNFLCAESLLILLFDLPPPPLRKHKAETAENKRLLKDIMDKWSRPIFAKSVDVRSNGGMTALLQDNVDVSRVCLFLCVLVMKSLVMML